MVQLRESVRELLADKAAPDKADELARLLSDGTWTHDHPITFETARGFGLPVRSDIAPELLDLMVPPFGNGNERREPVMKRRAAGRQDNPGGA
jgi:hypothetical protein